MPIVLDLVQPAITGGRRGAAGNGRRIVGPAARAIMTAVLGMPVTPVAHSTA